MSESVAEILINIESIKFSFKNHFTLTSGLKSPVYVDCRKIISFVKERNIIINKMINYFQEGNLNFDKLNFKSPLFNNSLILFPFFESHK